MSNRQLISVLHILFKTALKGKSPPISPVKFVSCFDSALWQHSQRQVKASDVCRTMHDQVMNTLSYWELGNLGTFDWYSIWYGKTFGLFHICTRSRKHSKISGLIPRRWGVSGCLKNLLAVFPAFLDRHPCFTLKILIPIWIRTWDFWSLKSGDLRVVGWPTLILKVRILAGFWSEVRAIQCRPYLCHTSENFYAYFKEQKHYQNNIILNILF